MSAFAGIYILSKRFNTILSIPSESTKTLYIPSILIDMDEQTEPGPDQVKVSQLPLTTCNLYNKLCRVDSRIIRSKNRLLIFRNHLKLGTLPKGYSLKINPSIGSNCSIFTDKWQSNIDNYGKMQLKLTINETELLIKSLTEQSSLLKGNLKTMCSCEVSHSLINKINITNKKLEQQLVSRRDQKPKHKIINILLIPLLFKYMI